MVASRIFFLFCFVFYILCFVCGSQSRCSRANAEQRLKIVGLVGGGPVAACSRIRFSFRAIIYFTLRTTNEKHTKKHPFIIITERSGNLRNLSRR